MPVVSDDFTSTASVDTTFWGPKSCNGIINCSAIMADKSVLDLFLLSFKLVDSLSPVKKYPIQNVA